MKKLLTGLFVAILVLAGCGASTSDGGSTSGSGDQSSSIEDALSKLEGETITIATSDMGGDNPLSEKAKENGQDTDGKLRLLEAMQEEYGITIEFVDLDPAAQMEEITESILAGEPIADVVRVYSGNYEALMKMGMLEDITYYADMAVKEGLITDWAKDEGTILGTTYAIGRDNDPRAEMLAFDTDLLKKAGMDETPFDLWKRDEWTWENARQYFLDVQAGLGDDFTVWGDYPTYIRQYGIASGGVVAVQNDGTINYDTPEAYEAVDYYKGLYDDGILKFYFDEDGNRDYAQAEEAWTSGNSVFFSLQRWKTGGMASDGKNFGLVPYPIKDGLDKTEVFWPAPAGDMYVVPKGVDNVEKSAIGCLFMKRMASDGLDEDGKLGDPRPMDEVFKEVALRDLSVEGNEDTLMYMYEQSVYEPIGAFISDTDDAFSPTTAVQEYIVNGASLTSAFEAGQKELEANVEAAKTNQEE